MQPSSDSGTLQNMLQPAIWSTWPDIFGPRGDEKSGCRDGWVAHCTAQNTPSIFQSFGSNCFNNSEGTAAVIHHKYRIIDFLINFHQNPNLRQRSILEDTESEEIIIMVTDLAVMYVYITGPFWILINCDIHYLDLYKHIQKMEHHLRETCDTPGVISLMLQDLPSCLETFPQEDTLMVKSVRSAAALLEDCEDLHSLVQLLAMNFLKVINNQLSYFLPDGRYRQEPSETQRWLTVE